MKRTPKNVLLLAALAIMLLASVAVGCAADEADTPELKVSAAAGLKTAFVEIGAAFDAANNSQTSFNFNSAGALQTQIEAGAAVDVFASGATKQMEALLGKGLVDEDSIKVVASNEIVLVVPAASSLGLTGFEDLAAADVARVAYGDPATTASGPAAEAILTKLGIYDRVKPKSIYTSTVTQALEYVRSGEVDAGIIFSSEAKIAGDEVTIVATADPAWHGPIAFPIAIVSASSNKTLAQAFIDFVWGPDGQAILQRYGFLAAPTE